MSRTCEWRAGPAGACEGLRAPATNQSVLDALEADNTSVTCHTKDS